LSRLEKFYAAHKKFYTDIKNYHVKLPVFYAALVR